MATNSLQPLQRGFGVSFPSPKSELALYLALEVMMVFLHTDSTDFIVSAHFPLKWSSNMLSIGVFQSEILYRRGQSNSSQ